MVLCVMKPHNLRDN